MRNLFLAFAVLFLFSFRPNVLYRVRFGGAKGPDNTEWHSIAAAGGESRHLTIPEKFEPLGFTRDGSALYGTFEMNKMAQLATLALATAGTPTSARPGLRSIRRLKRPGCWRDTVNGDTFAGKDNKGWVITDGGAMLGAGFGSRQHRLHSSNRCVGRTLTLDPQNT